MKKLIAGFGLLVVVTLMSLGLAGSAQAANYAPDSPDEEVATSTVDSNAGSSPSTGVLPATGGPETALLVGGAALVAVGGVALVASRRRARA